MIHISPPTTFSHLDDSFHSPELGFVALSLAACLGLLYPPLLLPVPPRAVRPRSVLASRLAWERGLASFADGQPGGGF